MANVEKLGDIMELRNYNNIKKWLLGNKFSQKYCQKNSILIVLVEKMSHFLHDCLPDSFIHALNITFSLKVLGWHFTLSVLSSDNGCSG
ncbi:MAG: hypothetical protein CVT98_03030 [Bacteroidetes bacterium HGW-Bacteroidetes-15]|nr:MAG: hypothetical protein CVT98_03030 [Bacteroidetes bacterium HGW-Bacteroidetes-15]